MHRGKLRCEVLVGADDAEGSSRCLATYMFRSPEQRAEEWREAETRRCRGLFRRGSTIPDRGLEAMAIAEDGERRFTGEGPAAADLTRTPRAAAFAPRSGSALPDRPAFNGAFRSV